MCDDHRSIIVSDMTRVLVPYRVAEPKTRLEPVLDANERRELSRCMLEDVLSAVRAAGYDPTVLSTAPLSETNCIVDDRPLTAAVNAHLELGAESNEVRQAARDSVSQAVGPNPTTQSDDTARRSPTTAGLRSATAVVMADLALTTSEAITRLLETTGDVVFAPGRGGGTNAVVTRHPDFRVDYHGASYRDHLAHCEAIGANVRTIDSYRLGTDIDEPADLAELLIHGTGTAADWLSDRFTLCTDAETGRVGIERV